MIKTAQMSNIRIYGNPAMAFAVRALFTACSIDMVPFTGARALRRARAARCHRQPTSAGGFLLKPPDIRQIKVGAAYVPHWCQIRFRVQPMILTIYRF